MVKEEGEEEKDDKEEIDGQPIADQHDGGNGKDNVNGAVNIELAELNKEFAVAAVTILKNKQQKMHT